MANPVRLVLSVALAAAAGAALVGSRPALGAPPSKDVLVTNPASDPVLVKVVSNEENPARQAFQDRKRMVIPDAECCGNAFVDVPAGKRLVIEYASAWSSASGSQPFVYEVGTRLSGQAAHTLHLLPVLQTIFDGNTTAIAGQQVRLYADPGPGNVILRAGRSGGGCSTPLSGCGDATVFMTISGHLVDLP
jgi:hypothetical protein